MPRPSVWLVPIVSLLSSALLAGAPWSARAQDVQDAAEDDVVPDALPDAASDGVPDGVSDVAPDGAQDAPPEASATEVASGVATASGTGSAAGDGAATRFDREWLVGEARRLSLEPDDDRRMPLEGDYAELGYEGYKALQVRPDARPWGGAGLPFEVEPLPPGFLFDRPVRVHLVEDGRVAPLPYDPALVDIGPAGAAPSNPDDLAWTGVRLRSALNRPDGMDEVAVFQGASYFRAVAREQLYGLAARGLAIDTAEPSGEEFPRFSAFWIERPDPEATSLTVHALLESASVTGAYTFVVTPGSETRMDVRTTLFPRRDLAHVGIAPLTSMFLYDATNRERFDDWREAVHDSNALQIVNGAGERLLRSLGNHETLQISSFVDRDPVGFGLVQRRRAFGDYEDAGARYDLRPSAWVEPTGAWGAGRVELVEIPSRDEIHDNVVAYWRPDAPLAAGSRHDFDYRLTWTARPADAVPLWRVHEVRTGDGAGEARRIVVDFVPPGDVAVPAGGFADSGTATPALPTRLAPRVEASAGEVRNIYTERLPDGRRVRTAFDYDPQGSDAADLRLRLVDENEGAASETWLWRWTR